MLINRLVLKNILSFRDTTIELSSLNVLIGPNAVGKSNLIEAIGLLQSAQSSLANAILRGGGVRQWIWLGDRDSPVAEIICDLELSRGPQPGPVRYSLQFSDDHGLVIVGERVEGIDSDPVYLNRISQRVEMPPRPPMFTSPADSVLSQFRSLGDPTPVTEVGNHFSRIRIYREFRTGPQSGARYGISTSVPKDALTDGSDNLAMVLQQLDFLASPHEKIRVYLKRFCERFKDVKVDVSEGFARAVLREEGLNDLLSVRMSDGTLKFLSLLAALFYPTPPPLMCIEEPEIGLHPDALQLVAEVLLEASESMQLIVTTHSEALVDALSHRSDAVLVCERDFDNGTIMKRLKKDDLKEWLQDYSLGELWRKGEIGGGRW